MKTVIKKKKVAIQAWKECPTCGGHGWQAGCKPGTRDFFWSIPYGPECTRANLTKGGYEHRDCPTCIDHFADMKKATKAERERCAGLMEHYEQVAGLAGRFVEQDLFRSIASWIREGNKHVVITVGQILKNVKRLERSGRL